MEHGDDDSIAAGAAYGYSVERSIVHYRGVQGGAGKRRFACLFDSGLYLCFSSDVECFQHGVS